jgi:arylsulfatase A-like enzyme
MPTVLGIAGREIPEFARGVSAKLIIEGRSEPRDEVFIQISETQIGRAIRTKKWKYSVKAPFRSGFFSWSSKIYREEYLYDLENDPAEHNNLVKDIKYKNIRKELKEKIISYIKEIEGYTPIIWNSRRFKIINR